LASRDTYTASLSSFAGRKAIFLLAAIWIEAPVAGFRPMRAARARTCRIPRPANRILSPFLRCWVVSATKSPSMRSASFVDKSWLSANLAAICLSVIVACGAAFTGAAFFAGTAFFAAGAAFLPTGAALAAATAFAGARPFLAALFIAGGGAFLAAIGFLAGGTANFLRTFHVGNMLGLPGSDNW
jgi:hypothetical protein